MGQPTDAILAYGYNLHNGEEWLVQETDKYGDLTADWYDSGSYDESVEESIEEPDSDSAQLMRRLLDASGFTERWEDGHKDYYSRETEATKALGLQVETYCSDDYPMLLLATHVITVNRGDTNALDMAELAATPAANGWDAKLTDAFAALGLTPTQDGPRWLLCSYQG